MYEVDWVISIIDNGRKPLISGIFGTPEGWNLTNVVKKQIIPGDFHLTSGYTMLEVDWVISILDNGKKTHWFQPFFGHHNA